MAARCGGAEGADPPKHQDDHPQVFSCTRETLAVVMKTDVTRQQSKQSDGCHYTEERTGADRGDCTGA